MEYLPIHQSSFVCIVLFISSTCFLPHLCHEATQRRPSFSRQLQKWSLPWTAALVMHIFESVYFKSSVTVFQLKRTRTCSGIFPLCLVSPQLSTLTCTPEQDLLWVFISPFTFTFTFNSSSGLHFKIIHGSKETSEWEISILNWMITKIQHIKSYWNATKAVSKGTFTPLNTDILERRKFSVQWPQLIS